MGRKTSTLAIKEIKSETSFGSENSARVCELCAPLMDQPKLFSNLEAHAQIHATSLGWELEKTVEKCFPTEDLKSEEETAEGFLEALGLEKVKELEPNETEEEKKEMEFKLYTAMLSRYARMGPGSKSELSCSQCSYQLNPKHPYKVSQHITTHSEKNIYFCNLCEYETKVLSNIQQHSKRMHEAVYDWREELDDQLLLQTTQLCFPVTLQLDFWHPNLPQSLETLLKNHPAETFRRLLQTFPRPLFKCVSCNTEDNDIWRHVYSSHKMSSSGDNFTDSIEENAEDLEKHIREHLGAKKKATKRKASKQRKQPKQEVFDADLIQLGSSKDQLESSELSNVFNQSKAKVEQSIEYKNEIDESGVENSTPGAPPRKKYKRKSMDNDLKYPPKFKLCQSMLSFCVKQRDETIPCEIPECKFVFNLNNSRQGSHILSHSGKRLYSCLVCGKTEVCRDFMFRHFSRKHPKTPYLGQISDKTTQHDELLEKLSLRCFPILSKITTWFPDTPPEIQTLIQGFRSGQLGCCETEKVPRTEIQIYRHVLLHFEIPLFQCKLCNYKGQEIWEHISETHALYINRELFIDLQTENKEELMDHFRYCFGMDPTEERKNLKSSFKKMESEEEEMETKVDEKYEAGTYARRLLAMKTEIKKQLSHSQRTLCAYEGCAKELTEANLRTHLPSHIRLSLFSCSECGEKFSHNNNIKHNKDRHEGRKLLLVDHTSQHEVELNRCLDLCCPLLSEVEFWAAHYPEDRDDEEDTKWDEAIFQARLENQGRSLKCEMCRLEIPRRGNFHSELDLRSHVFSHLEADAAQFNCELCDESVRKIWTHHALKHRGEDYKFAWLAEVDLLTSLTTQCFPVD